MRIIYFGSAQFGIPSLEAISHSRHELVRVFTQPARPSGRHRSKPTPTDVAIWCQKHTIPCIEAKNINKPEMVRQIADCKADLLVVIAFGQKVSQEVIGLQKHGAVNVHGSLLPKYRGAAPIHWAMVNGEIETGISIITLADRMDAGMILAQGKMPIGPEDTFQTMHDKLSELSVPVLMQTIEQLANGTATFTEQDESQVTYAHKLQKKDGFIDWEKPAGQIVNQIRGLWPWPSAQSVYVSAESGKHWRVTISNARALPRESKTGDVVGQLDENLHVICEQGVLDILELKPAGSGLMNFESYVNGHNCQPGDLFVSADIAMNGIF
ncbi:MAG: methionyl-tRNA formyltransferase [Phycisphaerae bacterium]|nr:methionyl-tRNA formyltransferase [Phycisphaerae bacterium]